MTSEYYPFFQYLSEQDYADFKCMNEPGHIFSRDMDGTPYEAFTAGYIKYNLAQGYIDDHYTDAEAYDEISWSYPETLAKLVCAAMDDLRKEASE